AGRDRACQRLEDTDDAAKKRRLAGAVGTDDRQKRAGGNLAIEVMHRRMAVITQRYVAELQGRDHAHLIAPSTIAHRTALTPSAAATRALTVIRRIDHGAAWAGCGDAAP